MMMLIYKIKMWVLRKFFPKKYYERIGKEAVKKMIACYDRYMSEELRDRRREKNETD